MTTLPVSPEKLLLIGGMSLMQVAETICDYEDAMTGTDRNAYKTEIAEFAVSFEMATVRPQAA